MLSTIKELAERKRKIDDNDANEDEKMEYELSIKSHCMREDLLRECIKKELLDL